MGATIDEAAMSLQKLLMLEKYHGFIGIGNDGLHVYLQQPDPGWITMKSWEGYKVEWHFNAGPIFGIPAQET